MSYYVHTPLIALFINLFLIFLVLRKDHRSSLHQAFSLFLLGMGLWGLAIFGMRSSPDLESALRWDKAVIAIGPWMGVFFYHFSLLFSRAKPRMWLVPSAYLLCILFSALAPTGLLFKGMQMGPYGYAPILGVLAYPAILIVYLFIILGLSNLVRFYRTNPDERNRTVLIIAGVAFAVLGSVVDILHSFGLPIPPLGILGNILFGCLATAAILRYQFLDIHIVIRKGLAYALVSGLVVGLYVLILLLVGGALQLQEIGLAFLVVAILVITVALQPVLRLVQQVVDKWFYRDRYDYLKALETFSWQTQSLTGSAGLGSTMVNLLAKALRSSNVYLLQPSPTSSDFTTAFPTGVNNPTPAIHLEKRGALVRWLEHSNSMLSYEDIEIIPQLQAITSKERETLERIGAKLISPLKAPTGQLSGILILGIKLSEQPYNSEDKQLLYTICNHMSTNLENARLYNESQQEVEERKRAEEALKESQEFSSSLLTNSPNPVLVISQDTSIRYVNLALKKLTGFSSTEVIGRKAPYPWWTKETQKKTAKDLEKAVHQGAARLEELFQKKNGERFWVEIISAPIKSDGEFKYYLANWVDITERKQSEEREKELQKELYLSSRLASIGELAAGVAHQINNPLTGVLGFSQRLLRKSTDEEASQDLKRIYTEAERAAKIVQNLLTFARRREPKKEYSDVNNVVQSALELRAYELKTSNIEVITNLAPNLPQTMLDFHQIQEVFLNLILNAEQAMTDANSGGKFTIKTEENNKYVRTTFTDNGPGIPAEHLDKIFDPFFTTKGEKGGTGLGLSVCHGIITEHGGRIHVKSRPREGTTFFVELLVIADK